MRAQQVAAADVAIEAPIDASFRLQSFQWLLSASCQPPRRLSFRVTQPSSLSCSLLRDLPSWPFPPAPHRRPIPAPCDRRRVPTREEGRSRPAWSCSARCPRPSTPSGMIPPRHKASAQTGKKPRRKKKAGGEKGHSGHQRSQPDPRDRRDEHRLDRCPDY